MNSAPAAGKYPTASARSSPASVTIDRAGEVASNDGIVFNVDIALVIKIAQRPARGIDRSYGRCGSTGAIDFWHAVTIDVGCLSL